MPLFHYILSQPVVDINNTGNTKNTRTNMQTSLNKLRRLYKFGLHFQETALAIRHALKPPCVCSYCDTKLFSGETEGICYVSGKIKLASTEHAAPLRNLFMKLDEMGNKFHVNIRAYNSVFTFMSMGVKIDNTLANSKDRVYTFQFHGGIYYSIGSLLPDNETPKFLQLYIYDTENEMENRLTIMPKLRHDTLDIIKLILDEFNPFVANFRSIASNNAINNLQLIIKADHDMDQ
ncbi:17478_t:CDS:2 [Dentiscutata erythropus]|uniref:17478_t:CDS:1 n=1 Tax=Dentiscutata erythropus TaxID=1348616 RepID=A0A9N9IWB2_9GLOM|nr:17478_t:CDS:2 [Dentiscutata erythropus]